MNRRLVILGIAALLTVLIIGGLTQVSRNSGPYDAATNRSFATQVSAIAAASNLTAASLRHIMSTLPTQDRQTLQVELDGLVQQTSQQDTRVATLATPAPSGQIAQEFDTIFADRAQAMSQVRGALDGLLGMHPVPVAGATAGSAMVVSTPTLLSSSQATARITAAGALLARSDRNYEAVGRTLARSAGHARLPASRWIGNGQLWQAGALATQVDQVEASPTLRAHHQLLISAIRLFPPALPSASGVRNPTESTLSPTTTVTVSVVLTNQGSVDEPRALVHVTLTAQPAGRVIGATRIAAVAASRSVAVAPASFAVKPGLSYLLAVSVAKPPAQSSAAGTSVTRLLQIAPASPTTTVAG